MKTILSAALIAALLLPSVAHAQQAGAAGVGLGISRSSSQSIGVGNNFGNQSNRQGQGQGQSQGLSNVNTNNIVIPGTGNRGTLAGANNSANTITSNSGNFNERSQAPSVFAPSVGSASPCDSYFSLGASGPGAGASFAFPWQNHNCDMRANSLVLQQLGMKAAARQRMCYDQDTADAMASVGIQCAVGPRAPRPEQTQAYATTTYAAPPPAGVQSVSASSGDYWYAKGRRYIAVPCTQKHATHDKDGTCLNPG